MKVITLVLFLVFVNLTSQSVLAQDFGVVTGSSHKTESGKYPFFYNDGGQSDWNDASQKEYDIKMGSTLNKICVDQKALSDLEKQYIEADHKDGEVLNAHAEIGTKVDALRSEMQKLSNIVMTGTGQSASTWGCQ